MNPAARVQAAIELLDAIIIAARDDGAAADVLAAQYFRQRRYIGSKDRRAVRDLAWQAIRSFGDRPHTGRAAMVGLARQDQAIAALFDGSSYGPAAIDPQEHASASPLLPAWIARQFVELADSAELAALLERAPLDLRVNPEKANAPDLLAVFENAALIEGFPHALRLPTGSAIEQTDAFQQGAVEVQDLGSQAIAVACNAQPGMTVLDLCAGAGGKTLALAAMMGNHGRIIAADTNRGRLDQLAPRAERAGVSIIETRLLNPGKELAMLADLAGQCELVMIDAPCSGSGTWRRNPEARWRLTQPRLDRIQALQSRLLDIGAAQVKQGGALVYAVCSLIEAEGDGQMSAFLARTPTFAPAPIALPIGRENGQGLCLTPFHDGTDGFYFARAQSIW